MKTTFLIIILLVTISCSTNKSDQLKFQPSDQTIISKFQDIIDSANVEGSILIYDINKDEYYSNNFEWAKIGHLPASTYKITNSIIALETGVVIDEHSIFKWSGEERFLKNWEQDLTLKEAFHFSCVPCYQEVARKIGPAEMSKYLNKLKYGNMQVDSSNIDIFWLEGESKINQFEQIDFLKRFYHSKLPISKRTETIMKRMIIIEENDQYTISGKTGWSIRRGRNNGWFVGYLTRQDNTYFFATNIEPKKDFDMKMFPLIRNSITYRAFEELKIK